MQEAQEKAAEIGVSAEEEVSRQGRRSPNANHTSKLIPLPRGGEQLL